MTMNIPDKLKELNQIFDSYGFELVFVGGCVRDTLMGIEHKDIDLATSATPDEQIDIYLKHDIHYIETGLQHGTVTVVIDNEPYEITTYRIDQETDGRHASVEYTRSLYDDLFRRDLTVNAIAMDFDGNIFDPFDGIQDIINGVVRFVGNPVDRIQEDYLRILRFFRFYGRISKTLIHAETMAAITDNRDGLKQISVERVWAEMAKIIAGPNTEIVLQKMRNTGVLEVIGIDQMNITDMSYARKYTSDPAILLAFLLKDNAIQIGIKWKLSNVEKARIKFVIDRAFVAYTVDMAKLDLFNAYPLDLVQTVLKVQGNTETLGDWVVPTFPVTGDDLIASGMHPGPEMGKTLKAMCADWVASDYTLDKQSLMNKNYMVA